jgi:hypothetical protein
MLTITNRNVLDVESGRSIIRNKIHWKSFVQSQLLLVQRADDGTDQIDARASNGQVLESSFGNVLSLPRVSQNLS